MTFDPFAQPWHAASVMASEVRRRQEGAEAAGATAAETAYGELLGDRAAMDCGKVPEVVWLGRPIRTPSSGETPRFRVSTQPGQLQVVLQGEVQGPLGALPPLLPAVSATALDDGD